MYNFKLESSGTLVHFVYVNC